MTTATEVRRSPLATLLSDEKVLESAQRLLEGERRLRRTYAAPNPTGNSQTIRRELFLAREDIRMAREDLAEWGGRVAQRIVQNEPIEVTA